MAGEPKYSEKTIDRPHLSLTNLKGIQAVRNDFFLIIKSCQYSMFYTNCR